jgi:hypothetical protein
MLLFHTSGITAIKCVERDVLQTFTAFNVSIYYAWPTFEVKNKILCRNHARSFCRLSARVWKVMC